MEDVIKISKLKVGEPRFVSDEEDIETANGPVVEYRLSQDEIRKKYGPPGKRSRQKQPVNIRYKSKAEREAAKMKVIDKVREALPKEKFGALLAQGLSGSQISKDHDVPYWAVMHLKEEYWNGNFNPDDYQELEQNTEDEGNSDNGQKETGQEPQAEPDPEPEPDLNHEPTPVSNELDLSGFDWAEPLRIGVQDGRKILTVSEKRVTISAGAINALRPSEFVQIGFKDGILVIVRGQNEKFMYKLPRKPKAAQIGGNKLVKFLLEKHGVKPGRYEMEEYKEGCLVAKIEV